MFSQLVTWIPIALGLFGALLTWRQFREDSLRRNEVLAWADEGIACLETLVVTCLLKDRPDFAVQVRRKLLMVVFDSAILVERGRLFFKNRGRGDGPSTRAAYSGQRSYVLDPLVAAHQVATRLLLDGPQPGAGLRLVAEDALKDFVSLMQLELGRDRTATGETRHGGSGFTLDAALAALDPARLAAVESKVGRRLGRGATG